MHLPVMYYLEATRPVEERMNFYCHYHRMSHTIVYIIYGHAMMHCALIVMNTHLDLAVRHLHLS